MRRVLIFDTTLRDGEQAPGMHLTPEQKLRIAKALEKAGVDIIEAGFPINSPSERGSVSMIAREIERSEVSALCRPIPSEIDLCEEVLSKASRSRLHLWIATSPIHMKYKLNMTPAKVMDKAICAIRYASGKFDTIQFSSEDATRSHLDFLGKIMREAVRAGADIVNLADTVGCALPEHIALMVKEIRRSVKDRVPVGIHCHNDLGLATSNTLSAIKAGARQVDLTVTGVGERSGNTSLEQVVVALMFHQKHFRVETNMDMQELGNICDVVIREMGIRTGQSQPLIGENSFRHESGIHVHGMLNNPLTYELVDPSHIGLTGGTIVIGKHTGKAAVRHLLEKNGVYLSEDDLTKLTELVKEKTVVSGPLENEKDLLDFAVEYGFDVKNKEGRPLA
ncbi:MAG: 2-isopropylmalate synthase [Candidatus Thermoplasmatota archaeon]|nr:2-isopropylmalate synthase [Candidatus Thermoplasmatota archaeon]